MNVDYERRYRLDNNLPWGPERPAWFDRAACAGQGNDDWFDPGNAGGRAGLTNRTRRAVAVCEACPVRARCLDFALRHNEQHGVWGGLQDDLFGGAA